MPQAPITMPDRVLFVCSQGSGLAFLAGSLLASASDQWEVWSTPPTGQLDIAVIEQVLSERGIMMLPVERRIVPRNGMEWETAIILCNGADDT